MSRVATKQRGHRASPTEGSAGPVTFGAYGAGIMRWHRPVYRAADRTGQDHRSRMLLTQIRPTDLIPALQLQSRPPSWSVLCWISNARKSRCCLLKIGLRHDFLKAEFACRQRLLKAGGDCAVACPPFAIIATWHVQGNGNAVECRVTITSGRDCADRRYLSSSWRALRDSVQNARNGRFEDRDIVLSGLKGLVTTDNSSRNTVRPMRSVNGRKRLNSCPSTN